VNLIQWEGKIREWPEGETKKQNRIIISRNPVRLDITAFLAPMHDGPFAITLR
jgi:hypothetical protein